eukprot:7951433-Pyramimonas_sp.AAC.1
MGSRRGQSRLKSMKSWGSVRDSVSRYGEDGLGALLDSYLQFFVSEISNFLFPKFSIFVSETSKLILRHFRRAAAGVAACERRVRLCDCATDCAPLSTSQLFSTMRGGLSLASDSISSPIPPSLVYSTVCKESTTQFAE